MESVWSSDLQRLCVRANPDSDVLNRDNGMLLYAFCRLQHSGILSDDITNARGSRHRLSSQRHVFGVAVRPFRSAKTHVWRWIGVD